MGITEKSTTHGNDCLVCYSAGRTPLDLKVFFAGIKTGDLWLPGSPLPPNGYFDLVQDVSHACIWNQAHIGLPMIKYKASPAFIYLHLQVSVGVYAFYATSALSCNVHFVNNADSPVGNQYWGGTGHICTSAWMAEQIRKLTPMKDPDPRMELFPVDEARIVIRYAGKQDATNICFKLDVSP